MYVCICHAVTEKQVRDAAGSGVTDLWGLQAELGVASSCGQCRETASEILRETKAAQKPAEPVRYRPSAA